MNRYVYSSQNSLRFLLERTRYQKILCHSKPRSLHIDQLRKLNEENANRKILPGEIWARPSNKSRVVFNGL